MTPNQTQGIGHQKYFPQCTVGPESQIFVRFALGSAIFEIFHILGFPIDSFVNISKCHAILKLGRLPRKLITCWSNVLTKLLAWDENCKRRSVLKFPAPYGPVLRKVSNCHNIFNFLADRQKVIAYITPWLWYFAWSLVEVWWKLLNFCMPFGNMPPWPIHSFFKVAPYLK